MTRDDLLALRRLLLLGNPPYELNQIGKRVRKIGTPGLEERREQGDYDTNAAGIRMAQEACLVIIQHLLDRMRK